jgi:hypothetical protein
MTPTQTHPNFRGRLRHLTSALRDPRARRFDASLQRQCGARVAYHRGRCTYVVYRERGRRTMPLTYLDVGGIQNPPPLGAVSKVTQAVAWADSLQTQDRSRLLRLMDQRMADASRAETRQFVDEWLPTYMTDYKRIVEVLTDGRVRTKFFDFGRKG